jgi:hypothetical protein
MQSNLMAIKACKDTSLRGKIVDALGHLLPYFAALVDVCRAYNGRERCEGGAHGPRRRSQPTIFDVVLQYTVLIATTTTTTTPPAPSS